MESAETILVIILAAALAVSLLLSIVLLVICIKIANRVKRITEAAERFTDKATELGEFLEKAAGPLALGKIVASFVDNFRQGKKKGRGRR